jgi:sugar lactone lactonase YvrE
MSSLVRTEVVVGLAAVMLAFARPAVAQMDATRPAISAPQADSATAARSAYRRAVAAYRKRDIPTARLEMQRAADAWPTQQVYLQNSMGLAALARDTVDVTHWLGRLADLGIGAGVASDSMVRPFVGVPAFDAALDRLTKATAPVVRSRVRFSVPDTTLQPEGIAFDAKSGRWFVSSVRQRRVVAVDRDGTVHDFVRAGADGIGGVFGMAVDSVHRTLWVATTSLPRMQGFVATDSGRVGVYGYDLDSGLLRRRVWAPRDSSVRHTFGDVAVAPNGDVYVSDSEAPWLFALPFGGDTLVRFVSHPLFSSLQGMAFTPDGATMFVADYSHGLLRVDVRSRAVTLLHAPSNVTLLGVDGFYWRDGALVGIQNGVTPARTVRFCLDADGQGVRAIEILDRNPALADEPTLGAIVGDSLFYLATGQWEKFDDAGERVAGAVLRPATVLGVALESRTACRR